MNLIEAKQEFQIRYYYWAISEFEKEISESFSNLRTFKNGPIWEAHQFMQQIDRDEQLTLAKNLVRRAHPDAVKILGETLSDEDNLLLNRFDNFRSQFHGKIGINSNGEKIKCVSKSKLRKAVENAFIKKYGSRCVKILTTEGGWDPFFEMKFAGWIVNTSFSFGRHQSLISYQHSIGSEKKIPIQEYPSECWPPAMKLGRSLTLLSGFGIIGQTQWMFLAKEDVDPACNNVIKCCEHFFEAIPRLLKGLEFERITKGENEPDAPTIAPAVPKNFGR
jgi:hypothetical protein